MKIEQLIVQHLYNNKKVTLQDIGTFTLSPDLQMPLENEKEFNMPENSVTFEFNKKATQDEELINFIVAQTRKIKPLATSDLESYSLLAKQFLNIGKPFPMEGLGVLQKNQSGEYEFMQGTHINAKLDAAPALLKEKAVEEISFSTKSKEVPSNNKKWILLLLIFIVLAIAAALYYFLQKRNKDNNLEKVVQNTTDTIVPKKDTLINTIAAAPDTTAKTSARPNPDSSTFRIVIKEYPGKDAAEKAFTKLTSYGHKLVMYPKDSSTYIIAMPFKSPLADTLRVRDSLKIFFGGRPYVEKN